VSTTTLTPDLLAASRAARRVQDDAQHAAARAER